MTPWEDVQQLCKYSLLAEIGRGGMGEVFLAVAQGMAGFRKLVVLKQIRPDIAADPECLAMFLDEARLAALLNHPNVVQTYEAGEIAGRHFIAMEYLNGQSLYQVRSRVESGKLPLAMQIRILIEALAGLHYAHELVDLDGTKLNVVHRDITPQNIFVTYDGQIKLVDFGIAKAASATARSGSGMIRGNVRYLAPEQVRCEEVDRRADIFAVGVMLWEAITGERMWKGSSDCKILWRLNIQQLPNIDVAAPSSDPELRRICRRALAPNPAERYATAAELQHELERWLARKGHETPARAVGAFVAAHFDEERAIVKSLLEAYCMNSTPRRIPDVAPPTSGFEPTSVEGGRQRRNPMTASSERAALAADSTCRPEALTSLQERLPRVADPVQIKDNTAQTIPETLRSPIAEDTPHRWSVTALARKPQRWKPTASSTAGFLASAVAVALLAFQVILLYADIH